MPIMQIDDSTMFNFVKKYFEETIEIAQRVSYSDIENTIVTIKKTRDERGRLFFAGVGGSAANASHAVNDFRKICGIESHSLTDNVAELTARINDDSWESSLTETLKVFNPSGKDLLFVLSVGGGSEKTSSNLVHCMNYAKEAGMKILSIVSRDGGHAKKLSNHCILVPVVSRDRITPHAEGYQAVIWHCIVNGVCA